MTSMRKKSCDTKFDWLKIFTAEIGTRCRGHPALNKIRLFVLMLQI